MTLGHEFVFAPSSLPPPSESKELVDCGLPRCPQAKKIVLQAEAFSKCFDWQHYLKDHACRLAPCICERSSVRQEPIFGLTCTDGHDVRCMQKTANELLGSIVCSVYSVYPVYLVLPCSTPFTHLYSFIIILCCEVLKLQGFLSHDVYFWCCKFLPKSSDSTFRNISMLQMTRPKWIDGYCEAKVAPRLHAKCTLEVQ